MRRDSKRDAVGAELMREIPRFQLAAEFVNDAAAAVLALGRTELQYLELLQHGPVTEAELAGAVALGQREHAALLDRLELAGYARALPAPAGEQGRRVELTPHAREWIESLWGPLRDEGIRLFSQWSTRDLAVVTRYLAQASAMQEAHATRLRALASVPASSRSRPNRSRGGVSPAALRRVHVFAVAHLDGPLRLADLAARAQLSPYHFARAFKSSTGETPRAYVERLRVEKATELIRDTELPLADVALACGFSSQSRLTTAFRRATGFTPARYRRGTEARLGTATDAR
ncbi:AraC family transcriptional regulator [Pyxidicoccus xibeiensis]|uniref:AraC family transcriptional regulator n=1 Tax=Pyxidicoccus xibeiensis TaxID=2906759 RepID=UPI0020A70472|nr:helix-turn-helix domain-containing protein [Pyxidicoccus xibeiensis]MCP3138791.1 helix-turn-helix domain-containing protein [Pyxidicoccus xibeiensis]